MPHRACLPGPQCGDGVLHDAYRPLPPAATLDQTLSASPERRQDLAGSRHPQTHPYPRTAEGAAARGASRVATACRRGDTISAGRPCPAATRTLIMAATSRTLRLVC
jgi:hypothetical protein